MEPINKMNIMIVTDAWEPQVNGVVNTYKNILPMLRKENNVNIVHPYLDCFKRAPLVGYNEIEIALNPWRCKHLLDAAIVSKDRIHIATEGPLGLYAKIYLKLKKYPYTTCFHTMFPEFVEKRLHISTSFTYPFFRWFHNDSKKIFVSTRETMYKLEEKGFKNLAIWTRGVDPELFNPNRRSNPQRYIIYVARASKEKNIDRFCNIEYERKIFVGDGPYLEELKRRYSRVEFVGKKTGVELAELIANADAFVFPSKADTFGIVLLEAIACGTPVAAYDEPGPMEVIKQNENGYYCTDLDMSLKRSLRVDRKRVYETSQEWTWERSAKQFLEGING